MKNKMEVGLLKINPGMIELLNEAPWYELEKMLKSSRCFDIVRKYGIKCKTTYFSGNNPNYFVETENNGMYVARSSSLFKYANCTLTPGIRPVVKLSTMGIDVSKLDDEIMEAYYFEYPQSRGSNWELLIDIEKNKIPLYFFKKGFSCPQVEGSTTNIVSFREVNYKDDKYVLIPRKDDKGKVKDVQLVRIEPIVWIIDPRNDVAISKSILFPSIPKDKFTDEKEYLLGIKKYLNKTFVSDLEKHPTKFLVIASTKDSDKENAIKCNLALQILMKKHNLSLKDIEIDYYGRPFVRSMTKKEN